MQRKWEESLRKCKTLCNHNLQTNGGGDQPHLGFMPHDAMDGFQAVLIGTTTHNRCYSDTVEQGCQKSFDKCTRFFSKKVPDLNEKVPNL